MSGGNSLSLYLIAYETFTLFLSFTSRNRMYVCLSVCWRVFFVLLQNALFEFNTKAVLYGCYVNNFERRAQTREIYTQPSHTNTLIEREKEREQGTFGIRFSLFIFSCNKICCCCIYIFIWTVFFPLFVYNLNEKLLNF